MVKLMILSKSFRLNNIVLGVTMVVDVLITTIKHIVHALPTFVDDVVNFDITDKTMSIYIIIIIIMANEVNIFQMNKLYHFIF